MDIGHIGFGGQEDTIILNNKNHFSWFVQLLCYNFNGKIQFFICTSSSSDPIYIALYVFLKLRTCAILDFKVTMIPKLKNNHFCLFVMEKDPSFGILAHQALSLIHQYYMIGDLYPIIISKY